MAPDKEMSSRPIYTALRLRCRLGTESEASHAGERDVSSELHDKLGRLTYHVTHRLADVITRLNDWQRTLDDMLEVSE